MNFEDPSANNLRRFQSTVVGLGRPSPSSPSSVSGRLAGDLGVMPDAASPVLPSGMSVGSSLGLGTASPQSEFVASGATPLLGPSPTSAPVAGRRARVEPRATGASLGPPAAIGATISPTIQVASPMSAEAPAASGLSWLNDTDSSLQPAGSPTVMPSGLSAPPLPRPAGQALSSSSLPPFLMADVAQEPLPSFLDFASTGAFSGVGPVHSLPPRGAPAAAAGLPTTAGGAATDAANVEECRKKEVRCLYLTLDALDMELERLEERVKDHQVKEETELLALETSVLVKTTELEEKEQELASRRAELKAYTTERLEALASRYAEEMAAQAAEVRSLDGARFEKQLQQVCDMGLAADQAVRELREQAALVLEMQPYSEAGVRLALFSHVTNTVVPATGDASSSSSTAGAAPDAVGSPSAELSTTQLESTLRQAVMVLRGYCDKRLRHARDSLVDYLHTSTLDAAHSVRRGREQAWMQDAELHKQFFNRYMVDMMQRYMIFYKERALLKQDNVAALQADVRRMAAELRSHTAERLQQLLRDVTAKMTLSTQHHRQAAEEAYALLQKKAHTVVEGDMAMDDAQHRELESRLLAEADARRRRHHAEVESLTEQLQRLRRSGEAVNRNSFQALHDAAVATSSQHAQPLREEVLALKARLVERLRGGASGMASAFSVARMHAEELAHVLRSAVADEAARQQAASLLRQQCDELRRGLTTSLCTEVVERLQQTRCVQHAHQARIDALAKTWEAAHRQNLAAACSLILPVSSSTPGTADAQYVSDTYAAPQDVVSTALLDVLQNRLRARDDTRRSLLASRRQCTSAYLRKLEEMRDEQAALQDRCAALWSAGQTQVAQQRITQEVEVEVEKGLITVAAEQRVVDRDRHAVERKCRRTAEMTFRLRHEAPQHLLCGSFPPLLQEVVTTHPVRTQPLTTVDINAMPKPSNSTNTFTTVHASNNATTMTKKNSAEAPPSPSSFSPSPASEAFQAKRRVEVAAPGQKMCRTPSTAEASHDTDTQPWSSVLLRAEQRLPQAGTREGSDVLSTVQGSQQGPPQSDSAPIAHHGVHNEGAAKVLASLKGAQEVDSTRVYCRLTDTTVEAEGATSTRGVDPRDFRSPRDTADEKQRIGSSSLDASLPPVSSMWAADSDTDPVPRTYAMTSPAALPAQRQWQQRLHAHHPPRDLTLSQTTWSTLEEYLSSSADAPNRAVTNRDVEDTSTANFIATGSLDDLSNFIALLSCANSPASSSVAQ